MEPSPFCTTIPALWGKMGSVSLSSVCRLNSLQTTACPERTLCGCQEVKIQEHTNEERLFHRLEQEKTTSAISLNLHHGGFNDQSQHSVPMRESCLALLSLFVCASHPPQKKKKKNPTIYGLIYAHSEPKERR